MIVNGIIMVLRAFSFWLEITLSIQWLRFLTGRVADAISLNKKKMQAMIVTSNQRSSCTNDPEDSPWVTLINDAEGTYNHEREAVLLAIITRESILTESIILKKQTPKALVSIAENVHILGRFVDLDD